MERYYSTRLHLDSNWQAVAVANNTLLPEYNPNLKRFTTITEIQIGVYLPSLEEFDFVPDSSLDLAQQTHDRDIAFSSAEGILLYYKIDDFEIKMPFKLVNSPGGYYFDLVPNIGANRQSIFLADGEELALKLVGSLGSEDAVSVETLFMTWVEEI